MKRGKISFFRFSLLLSLTALFLYSASVQEIHYLFVDHHIEINEHCDNHLHAKNNHTECNLCKIDLSSFVQTFQQFVGAKQVFLTDRSVYSLLDANVAEQFATISLRGPPVLA